MPVAIGIRDIDIPVLDSVMGAALAYRAIKAFVPKID